MMSIFFVVVDFQGVHVCDWSVEDRAGSGQLELGRVGARQRKGIEDMHKLSASTMVSVSPHLICMCCT